MPKDMEEMMDYEAMLDQLAEEYPQVAAIVSELQDELMELTPDEEEVSLELDLEEPEEEPDLELSL